VQAVAQATVHDERLLLVHFFDLPVVPFRLEGGGVGFINPAKISRVTAHPAVNAAPIRRCRRTYRAARLPSIRECNHEYRRAIHGVSSPDC